MAGAGIIPVMKTDRRPVPAADDAGMDAWVRFLQAHAAVTRRLEAELRDECAISLAEYETLLHLAQEEDGSLRMSDLAVRLLLSRSGVTRLVDRLEASGDVERRTCPSDARGSFARLTVAGRARLRAAAPVHLRGVREHFLDVIPEGEIGPLGRTLARLTMPDPAQDAVCAGAVDAPREPASVAS
jgi:DNA-binding MarR family transcriptional regulator